MQLIMLHEVRPLPTAIFESFLGLDNNNLLKVVCEHPGGHQASKRATANDGPALVFGLGRFSQMLEVGEASCSIDYRSMYVSSREPESSKGSTEYQRRLDIVGQSSCAEHSERERDTAGLEQQFHRPGRLL